jgi:hypothetical protein
VALFWASEEQVTQAVTSYAFFRLAAFFAFGYLAAAFLAAGFFVGLRFLGRLGSLLSWSPCLLSWFLGGGTQFVASLDGDQLSTLGGSFLQGKIDSCVQLLDVQLPLVLSAIHFLMAILDAPFLSPRA